MPRLITGGYYGSNVLIAKFGSGGHNLDSMILGRATDGELVRIPVQSYFRSPTVHLPQGEAGTRSMWTMVQASIWKSLLTWTLRPQGSQGQSCACVSQKWGKPSWQIYANLGYALPIIANYHSIKLPAPGFPSTAQSLYNNFSLGKLMIHVSIGLAPNFLSCYNVAYSSFKPSCFLFKSPSLVKFRILLGTTKRRDKSSKVFLWQRGRWLGGDSPLAHPGASAHRQKWWNGMKGSWISYNLLKMSFVFFQVFLHGKSKSTTWRVHNIYGEYVFPNRSEGFSFYFGGLGVGPVFAGRCFHVRNRATVRNRPRPAAKVHTFGGAAQVVTTCKSYCKPGSSWESFCVAGAVFSAGPLVSNAVLRGKHSIRDTQHLHFIYIPHSTLYTYRLYRLWV